MPDAACVPSNRRADASAKSAFRRYVTTPRTLARRASKGFHLDDVARPLLARRAGVFKSTRSPDATIMRHGISISSPASNVRHPVPDLHGYVGWRRMCDVTHSGNSSRDNSPAAALLSPITNQVVVEQLRYEKKHTDSKGESVRAK